MNRLGLASWVVAGSLTVGAVAIGGGIPLTPRQIADNTRSAAHNAARAAENTRGMASDTEYLATIARNARSQYETSKKLLDTQLAMERSARSGVERSRSLQDGLGDISHQLQRLLSRLRALASSSDRTTSSVTGATAAARSLDQTLDLLLARFGRVLDESRELNRKARGYDRVRP